MGTTDFYLLILHPEVLLNLLISSFFYGFLWAAASEFCYDIIFLSKSVPADLI